MRLSFLFVLTALLLSGPAKAESTSAIFLCPKEVGVCSWSQTKGWQVIWTAEAGTDREQLSLRGGGSGLRVLRQKTPYGGTFIVFSADGRILATVDQGNPLEAGASVGHDPDGAVVVCSGVGHKACASWILDRKARKTGAPTSFPIDCLFPRLRGESSYCLKERKPLRDPKEPLRITVWESRRGKQNDIEHELTLPPGFLLDFMPLDNERALFVYEDGRVLEVRGWKDVRGPIATGALRLDELAGCVYIVAGPLLAEKGKILRVEEEGLKSVWTGPEIPAEVVSLTDRDLLVRLEEPASGRSKILLVKSEPGGNTTSQMLWDESRDRAGLDPTIE